MFQILQTEGIDVSGFCVDDEFYKDGYYFDKPLYRTSDFVRDCSRDEYVLFLPLSARN